MPATSLGDGDSIVHLSDIDPLHPEHLSSTFAYYSQVYNPLDKNKKFSALSLRQQKRAELTRMLWNNLQELRQRIDSSASNPPTPFSSLSKDAASQSIYSLWYLLKCQYGEKLQTIFPEKKLVKTAVVAGDSGTTQALNELLKIAGYKGAVGFVDLDQLSYFNVLFGFNTVYENPDSNMLVHRFSGATLGPDFISETRIIDPFDAKFNLSIIRDGFIKPALQRDYKTGQTHLDYLMDEFKKRMKSSLSSSSAPLFQIRLGGNNLIDSMVGNERIDRSRIRTYTEELDQKTRSLVDEYPGILRVFTLPPDISSIILREIRPENKIYTEDGKQLTEGYTIHSWFEEKDPKSGKVLIPKNMIFSQATYQRLKREYAELHRTIQETLEPLGWTVLNSSNDFSNRILKEGLSVDQLEGFGKVDLSGLEDLLTADGLHPKPITALGMALIEAWELGQHGVAVSFHPTNYFQAADEIILEELKRIVRQNPSQWFSDLRMPKQKILKLKEGLKTVSLNFSTLETVLSPYWVYFDREHLVQLLKLLSPSLHSLSFEKEAMEEYRHLSSKESISPVEGEKLQRHQLTHLIRKKMKDFLEMEQPQTLSKILKIVYDQLERKEEEYSRGINSSKTFFEGTVYSYTPFSKNFYRWIRA